MSRYEIKASGYVYITVDAPGRKKAAEAAERKLMMLQPEINADNMEIERIDILDEKIPGKPLKEFQVTCKRTMYYTATVYAENLDEAEDLVLDEAESVRADMWTDDCGIEVVNNCATQI